MYLKNETINLLKDFFSLPSNKTILVDELTSLIIKDIYCDKSLSRKKTIELIILIQNQQALTKIYNVVYTNLLKNKFSLQEVTQLVAKTNENKKLIEEALLFLEKKQLDNSESLIQVCKKLQEENSSKLNLFTGSLGKQLEVDDLESCKNKLLNVPFEEEFLSKVDFELNLSLTEEITEKRFKLNGSKEFSYIQGTTYLNSTLLSENIILTPCLDMVYHTYSCDVIADGYGHYLDNEANEVIRDVAFSTVKNVAKLANSYSFPDELMQDVAFLFEQTGKLVNNEISPNKIEEAGCAFSRFFKNDTDKVDIVSACVGDCSVFVWNPEFASISLLLHPRQHKVTKIFDPMAVSENLSGNMVQVNKYTAEYPSFVISMTDGAWQGLPYSSSKKYDEVSGTDYIEYQLDSNYIAELLNNFYKKNDTVESTEYCKLLQKEIIDQTNISRKNLIEVSKFLPEIFNQYKEKKEIEKDSLTDFIGWLLNNNEKFYHKIIRFLRDNEYILEDLKEEKLSDFVNQVEKETHMGDDVLVSVRKIEPKKYGVFFKHKENEILENINNIKANENIIQISNK